MQKHNEQAEIFLTSIQNHLRLANRYLLQNDAKLASVQIQKARYLLEKIKNHSN